MSENSPRLITVIVGILLAVLSIPILAVLKESGVIPEPAFSILLALVFPGLLAAAKLLYAHQTIAGSIVFVTVQAAYWLLLLWLWRRHRNRVSDTEDSAK